MKSFRLLLLLILPFTISAQPVTPKYDISKTPVLYTVGYAHLDTEWRWDYVETVNKYLKSTLDDNFYLFDKYKDYVFTFSGARRYKMMKEYYPERYERMKKYISKGRWFVGGSSVDECDANAPSSESIIRHVLYGNNWFRKEYGKESVDFLLPDCFGFQTSLPSILAHAGIKGFSTQKLGWGSAAGIPFNVGLWTGPDGNGVVAALNGTSYAGDITPRIDTTKYWVDRVMANGAATGVYADFRYYGTGDIGGSPREQAVINGIGSMNNPDSKFQVYLCSSDQLFRDLTPDQKKKLPTYTGDLLLTQHSAGSLTSESYMKRWNRKNELLAQSAEPLAVAANWLGGISYPLSTLNNAWWLVLGSQMHDILPGTSIPKAYEYAWNDEVLAMNLFAGVLKSSAGVILSAMDTRVKGIPVAVYNPLVIEREEVVEISLDYPEGTPSAHAVFGADGIEVPCQVIAKTKNNARIIFVAKAPSAGMAVYDVRPAEKQTMMNTSMASGPDFLENEYYKVVINKDGDISSIIDKKINKELLSAPSRLEIRAEHPRHWPAWNMDWADRNLPATAFVSSPVKMNFTENGPVRTTIKVERKYENSVFVQLISLITGGKRVEVRNNVEWQCKGVSLKATFPLTTKNIMATYNPGAGTIQRATNDEKKYEVPSKEWFDLTDQSGKYGVSILEDSKYGSDKPNDSTLRLTLLYTPVTNFCHDQGTQDWGIHDFTYAIYSHAGDWKNGLSPWQGRMLNQPLVVFKTSAHSGSLGNTFSLVKVSSPKVEIRAIKKAEQSEQTVIRLHELTGQDVENVKITFAGKVLSATEVDGQERSIGNAKVVDGSLVVNMPKYAIRSYMLTLAPPAEVIDNAITEEIPLIFDQDVVSTDVNKRSGAFITGGYGIPQELFPDKITSGGITFRMGSGDEGKFNALACRGQRINLPEKSGFNRIYILAAAVNDTVAVFRTKSGKYPMQIQGYTGKAGQFDNRTWDKYERITGLEKGFIKRDEVAWFATHVHKDTNNVPYQYAYICKYSVPADNESEYLQLPDHPSIKIFAITAAVDPYGDIQPVQPLYDDFSGRKEMKLALPKRIVTTDLLPLAKIDYESNSEMEKLPYRLTMKDYADMHMPAGVTLKYYYYGVDKTEGGMPEQGMLVSSGVDGMFDLLPSDSTKDVWFRQGEGRLVMDLQSVMELDSLHVFAKNNLKRGPQAFSLWGSDRQVNPSVDGDPKEKGWQFIAYSPSRDLWSDDKAVYSIKPENSILRYRYLMWVSEETMHGPYYFREVDIFEKQK